MSEESLEGATQEHMTDAECGHGTESAAAADLPDLAETSKSTFFGADSDAEDEEVRTTNLPPPLRKACTSEASLATCSTAMPTPACSCEPPEEVHEDLVPAVQSSQSRQAPEPCASVPGVPSDCCQAAHATTDQGRACVQQSGYGGELISDEGKLLFEALREAQAALDAARQFVTSPSLRPTQHSIAAEPAPKPSQATAPSPAACYAALASRLHKADAADEQRPVPEPMILPPEAPRPPPRARAPRRHSTGPPRQMTAHPAPPAVACAQATGASAAALAADGGQAAGRQRVNALHARFGEAAACARVKRARSLEVASRLQKEAEAEAEAAQRAAAEADMNEHRRRAAKRVASERRAKQEAEQEAEEQRALENMRKELQRSVGLRYAKSANRRLGSERSRREALTREVLASVQAEQAERREADLNKGKVLQNRCQESDWSECRPVVESRRRSTRARGSGSTSLPPERGSPDDVHFTLPSIRTGAVSVDRAEARQRLSGGGDTKGLHLPPLVAAM
eukprot:gb/GFBE01032977.1/.p1 GENE.gb/GFBE01032977.1/~~gb/GFBE01032977.1/.p1  ORF type:complete len:513 (+),score=79.14 gb/GFBE01032977.1/:1-1539(+)